MKYIPRGLVDAVEGALREMPVVVVTGMRQVGKSTMLKSDPGLSSRDYVNLDDFATMRAVKESPDAVIGSLENVTIDEAQRVGEVFIAVKRAVDRERKPGRFLLSGSANPALLKGVSESLAGRAIYLELSPMSRREIREEIKTPPFLIDFARNPVLPKKRRAPRVIDKDVLTGGLPPVALGEVGKPRVWFTGYEQTYLERDLRDVAAVEYVLGFRDLLKLSALRTAQILNIASLSRDAHLEAKTASRYLGWLEATYIVRRVQPYLRNKTSRIKKSPKLYITDSGLACHLTECNNLSDDPLRGALYETYAFQNIASIIENRIPPGRMYYWQTQAGREVDFVIELGRDVLAIEVKSGETWTRRDLGGLTAFLSSASNCKAAVLAYNGSEAIKLGDRLFAIPLGLLLS